MGKEQSRFTFWTLVWRSLRFHARAHLGVVLGAAVGSAALIGALIVGDSVRETLKERALSRLGPVGYALNTPDRLFESKLSQRITSRLLAHPVSVNARGAAYAAQDSGRPLSTALVLSAVVAKADGSARANAVNVMGVDAATWPQMAGWGQIPPVELLRFSVGNLFPDALSELYPGRGGGVLVPWRTGPTALLNAGLARQLGVDVGDEIVVRVHKPSTLGLDAALSPRDQSSVALRLKVGAIVPAGMLGDFSLSAQPLSGGNLFVPLDWLGQQVGVPGRANLMLFGQIEEQRKLSAWDQWRAQAAQWVQWKAPWVSARMLPSKRRQGAPQWEQSRFGLFLVKWLSPQPTKPVEDQEALPWLETQLAQTWMLEDAGLSVHTVEPPRTATGGEYIRPSAEVASARLFLESPVVAAALQPRMRLLTNHEDFLNDTRVEANFCQFVTNGVRILTYMANLMSAGDRATPYSMVTAADGPFVPPDMREDEILVNEWLAEDLKVKPGDAVALSYYVADSGSRLLERTNSFRVRGIVSLKGIYADRSLMPEFPGLAKAESTHEWDGGFPLVYTIRDKDEAYWKQYRGTPKAFISLAAGQKLWANRFGALTAIRYQVPTNSFASVYRNAAYVNLLANLRPSDLGLRIEPVRSQALNAAVQGQDFGQLFLGFSFFLVVAALLLMALLFQFGLEQRAGEVATLRALGFTGRQVRRLFLTEGALLALLGGIVGTFGGYAYAHAMLWGLATIWSNAVGSAVLVFHATPLTLVIGLVASTLVAVVTIWLTLRRLGRPKSQVPSLKSRLFGALGRRRPALINTPLERGERAGQGSVNRFNGLPAGGETVETVPHAQRASYTPLKRGVNEKGRWNGWGIAGLVAGVGAVGLVGWTLARGDTANAGAFFGAGALLLLAGLGWAAAWLDRLAGRGLQAASSSEVSQAAATSGAPDTSTVKRAKARAPLSRWSLAVRGCARRRNRSLATIALLACGCFIIVAIGVFRLDANQHPERRASGTGGFALIGNTTLPLLHDLNSPAGREFFGLQPEDLRGVACVPFRVRQGDDASCLNLGRSQKPRLLGVNPGLLAGRFSFAQVARGFAREWKILQTPSATLRNPQSEISNLKSQIDQSLLTSAATEEVLAVADANTIEWGLGKKIGDTLDYTDDQGRPCKVRLVGAVANSILQGSLLIDEAEFVRRFPNESGYRMVLLDAPPDSLTQVSAALSRALQDLGLELTPAAQRLNVLNAVENTYLSTFQVLGGLGLLLGSAGLGVVVLRNVLERRSELAVLLAVGFRRRTLQRMVLGEHAALLAVGLGIGMVAAIVAVLPALGTARSALPYGSLGLTLVAVCLNGLLWAWLATRYALRGNLVEALRKE
jgi:putative ABC transport system permease protein